MIFHHDENWRFMAVNWERKRRKKSSFFIRRRGENCTSCTHYTTLLLNALSFRIVREMMLGCRHLLLQLIKKLFPLFELFVFSKSETNSDMYLCKTKLDIEFCIFLCLNFPANWLTCMCNFKIQLNVVKIWVREKSSLLVFDLTWLNVLHNMWTKIQKKYSQGLISGTLFSYYSCILWMCLFKFQTSENDLQQDSHLWFLWP